MQRLWLVRPGKASRAELRQSRIQFLCHNFVGNDLGKPRAQGDAAVRHDSPCGVARFAKQRAGRGHAVARNHPVPNTHIERLDRPAGHTSDAPAELAAMRLQSILSLVTCVPVEVEALHEEGVGIDRPQVGVVGGDELSDAVARSRDRRQESPRGTAVALIGQRKRNTG